MGVVGVVVIAATLTAPIPALIDTLGMRRSQAERPHPRGVIVIAERRCPARLRVRYTRSMR
jgi:hypothetical protein